MQAFSEFINDESLTQQQIVFVRKVIDYIIQNGYIENVADLAKPPFDKPQSFMKLFDGTRQRKLVETVKLFKENAEKVVG
jgi:type I restriction enzyme R subunit